MDFICAAFHVQHVQCLHELRAPASVCTWRQTRRKSYLEGILEFVVLNF